MYNTADELKQAYDIDINTYNDYLFEKGLSSSVLTFLNRETLRCFMVWITFHNINTKDIIKCENDIQFGNEILEFRLYNGAKLKRHSFLNQLKCTNEALDDILREAIDHHIREEILEDIEINNELLPQIDSIESGEDDLIEYNKDMFKNYDLKDSADCSGKKFTKFRYCDNIWVDVKDDEHILSTNTAYETMAQTKEKASGNIKYQIKIKNHLPNSAKILIKENKIKALKENEKKFYNEEKIQGGMVMNLKDSMPIASPNVMDETSIINQIGKAIGKDLGNSGLSFYIIKGQNLNGDVDYDDIRSDSYEDMINQVREAQESDDDSNRGYDWTCELNNWIDSKSSDIVKILTDDCSIKPEEAVEIESKIRDVLKANFTPQKFYAGINCKDSCKIKDALIAEDVTINDLDEDEYADYEDAKRIRYNGEKSPRDYDENSDDEFLTEEDFDNEDDELDLTEELPEEIQNAQNAKADKDDIDDQVVEDLKNEMGSVLDSINECYLEEDYETLEQLHDHYTILFNNLCAIVGDDAALRINKRLNDIHSLTNFK